MASETKIQASIGHEAYATYINVRGHQLIGDEPLDHGGQDKGPRPQELVLSGLATCAASTMKMYADRKGWQVEQIFIEVKLITEKTDSGQISQITENIRIEGNIDADQKKRMVEIAGKCPVHRLLTNKIQIESLLVD